nr:integumentary mucin C.1-like isoform X3 [Crassostrea gigas]
MFKTVVQGVLYITVTFAMAIDTRGANVGPGTCFVCVKEVTFSNCLQHTTTCQQNEVCFTSEYIDGDGHVHYNSGCLSEQICRTVTGQEIQTTHAQMGIGHILGRKRDTPSNCFTCCSTQTGASRPCNDQKCLVGLEIPVTIRSTPTMTTTQTTTPTTTTTTPIAATTTPTITTTTHTASTTTTTTTMHKTTARTKTTTTTSGEHSGPKCYMCDDVIETENCRTTGYCKIDELCFTEKLTNHATGEVRYKLGCQRKAVCASLALYPMLPNSGSCNQCCDQNYCNSLLCGKSMLGEHSGPKCYMCDDVIEPENCRTTGYCKIDELCFTEKLTNHATGEVRYKLGCQRKAVCASLALYPMLPNSGSCNRCCDQNYCNSLLCGKSLLDLTTTTTPITTTTSATTTVANSNCTDGVHCQKYADFFCRPTNPSGLDVCPITCRNPRCVVLSFTITATTPTTTTTTPTQTTTTPTTTTTTPTTTTTTPTTTTITPTTTTTTPTTTTTTPTTLSTADPCPNGCCDTDPKCRDFNFIATACLHQGTGLQCPYICGLCSQRTTPPPCKPDTDPRCHEFNYAMSACLDNEKAKTCPKTCGLC